MDDISASELQQDEVFNISSFIIIPPDNTLGDLLKEWSMEMLLPKLLSKNINMDSLPYLTEIELNSVFKDDLGNQARFRAKLLEWKTKKNLPNYRTLSDSLDTLSNSSSTYSTLEKFCSATERTVSTTPTELSCSSPHAATDSFDLTSFFKTATGASIKSMYNAKTPPKFTPEIRDLFCTYVVRDYVEKNKCMMLTDFRHVTRQIIDYFPEENADFINFQHNENKFSPSSWKFIQSDYYFKIGKHPSGKLYNKYRVISNNLRKVGFFTDSKRRRSVVVNEPSDVSLTDEDEVPNTDKEWLKVHNSPWEIVEQKWQQTFDIRSQDLSKGKDIISIVDQWPLFTNTKGFRLVEIDFERVHPENASLLFKTWYIFKSKIIPILQRRLKDRSALELLKTLSNNEDIQPIQIFKLLHYILKPTGKHNLKGIIKKYTINDSIESFCIEVTNSSHVNEKIELAKEFAALRNIKLQPLIIFINTTNPQFCVVYDNIYYTFDKFLVALDICFKVFFVFKLEYPKQSAKFWLFVQKYLYQITTNFDHLTSDIIDVISEIEK